MFIAGLSVGDLGYFAQTENLHAANVAMLIEDAGLSAGYIFQATARRMQGSSRQVEPRDGTFVKSLEVPLRISRSMIDPHLTDLLDYLLSGTL
jgi:hypothetical protein